MTLTLKVGCPLFKNTNQLKRTVGNREKVLSLRTVPQPGFAERFERIDSSRFFSRQLEK